MHVVIDTDYFTPTASDTLEILAGNTNPRVEFSDDNMDLSEKIIESYKEVSSREIPLEKLILANYLLHGLDYCSKGSKRSMKENWPTQLENHEQGSDVGLILPVSPRAAKSIIRLSQSLDKITEEKGIAKESIEQDYFNSMMQAFKFVSAYSGVLNEAMVQEKYEGNKYKAMDAIIDTTTTQFKEQSKNISAGIEMIVHGKKDSKVLNLYKGRWGFMKGTLEGVLNVNQGV